MFKTPASKPWTCASCISRRLQQQRRLRSNAAVLTHEQRPILVDNTAPGALHDDKTLRKIFDSPDFWKDFSSSSQAKPAGHSSGLFRNRYLTSPRGFLDFSQSNLAKARRIVDGVLQASTVEEYKTIVKDLDRLSDMLCRVIDVSDFVRATHPDRRIQDAATRAYGTMYEYMNQLNTTTGLNEQLTVAMDNPEVMASWSEEEKVVARALKKDFTNSAIALPRNMRERFVELSQEISEVGHAFTEYMRPAKSEVVISSNKLKGMDPRLAKKLTVWGRSNIPTAGEVLVTALRTVHDESVRKELFIASRTSPRDQLERLDELVSKRAELAKLTGYESYGHLNLGDKMAKSPESVNQFLQALSIGNKPRVQQEMSELLKAKMNDLDASTPILQPWDKDFYISKIRSSTRSTTRNSDVLSAYFSLGTVMQGLSRLFSRLYGIRFVPTETEYGETWNSDVRRLDIISESDGHVAVLYCDLFSRPGKSPNPSHFTLRCSREIALSEVEDAAKTNNTIFKSPEEAVNDGMATSTTSGSLKQLPAIALICDFRTSSKGPSLLSFGEVQTLFHEFGHAIHSILGRTSLQEVSGTRCATDFAELPSVLMEHFAADPAVLSLFARHYETGQPLPFELVAESLALDRRFRGADTETQILLAMMDQVYHSSLPLTSSFDPATVYHTLQKEHGVMPPDPAETSWQGSFGHLFGYGSTYYSYLFDQVLSERIWSVVFKRGMDGKSIDRESGEKMKESVLKWGGGRDPWKCLADVLGDGSVESGGKKPWALSAVGA